MHQVNRFFSLFFFLSHKISIGNSWWGCKHYGKNKAKRATNFFPNYFSLVWWGGGWSAGKKRKVSHWNGHIWEMYVSVCGAYSGNWMLFSSFYYSPFFLIFFIFIHFSLSPHTVQQPHTSAGTHTHINCLVRVSECRKNIIVKSLRKNGKSKKEKIRAKKRKEKAIIIWGIG